MKRRPLFLSALASLSALFTTRKAVAEVPVSQRPPPDVWVMKLSLSAPGMPPATRQHVFHRGRPSPVELEQAIEKFEQFTKKVWSIKAPSSE